MVYDAHAQRVAVKAIGTVESNLNYASINYNDPITVGVMQWYGTRAASLLNEIRASNPSLWVGVPASLTDDLDANPENSSYWNSRYLSRAEGEPLKSVLSSATSIQDTRAFADLNTYLSVATSNGMDKDGNTPAVLFFFVMYHQSPRRALEVLSSAGPRADIERLYAVCLNNSVLGQYRTRYTTAKSIILANDDSGVGTPTPPTPEAPGGDGGTGTDRALSDIRYISSRGNMLVIHFRDGKKLLAPQATSDTYIITLDDSVGADVPDLPSNPTPGSDDEKRDGLLAWMQARDNTYAYRQAPGRLEPDESGYTDCSGLVHTAYRDVCGIEIGTWTGDQHNRGRAVSSGSGDTDTSSWKVGDLIFINWNGAGIGHVEMYAGNRKVWGHGGPDDGPDFQDIDYFLTHSHSWKVRRHLD